MNRKKNIITRRDLLEKGMAAATIGAAGLLAAPSVMGKAAQAPAVVTRRRFRAWISRGNGQGRTTLHEVTLRPIARQAGCGSNRSHEPLLFQCDSSSRPAG